jgi:hypothetical protein
MPGETSQLEWLVIALVYNHQYYDELYRATFPDDKNYIDMEMQKNNLFDAFDDIPFHGGIKMLIVEDRLKFTGTTNNFLLAETLSISQKTNANSIKPYPIDINSIDGFETMTHGTQLGKFLQKITEQCNAKRNVIITFGHGSILGINLALRLNSLQSLKVKNPPTPAVQSPVYELSKKQVTKLSPPVTEKVNIALNKKAEVKKLINEGNPFFTPDEFKQILNKTKELVILTNKELDQAIKIAYRTNKLDILVMFNCLMQNLYTQYELKESVQYLVAPVTGISYPGYNYRSVFAALQKNITMTTDAVANLFVNTIRDETFPPPFYHDKYYEIYKAEIEGTWKVTCVDLDSEKLEIIKSAFTDFMSAINAESKTNLYVFININYTLVECYNYAHHCLNNSQTMIDMLSFCTYFLELISKESSAIKSLIVPTKKLKESLETMKNTATFTGKQIFDKENYFVDIDYDKNYGFGFLLQTRLYPNNTIQRAVLSTMDERFFPEFLKDSGFAEFYKLYSVYNETDPDD